MSGSSDTAAVDRQHRIEDQAQVMRRQNRTAGWIIAAVVVLGAVLAVVGVRATTVSGEEFVEDHYPRAAHLDVRKGGVVVDAHTADAAPAAVAAAIADGARPLDRRTTSDGEHYLQYRRDIVAVLPRGSGSLVVADDYRDMHTVFRDDVGQWWSSTPPGSRGGTGWVGGGSGSGK